MTLHILRQLTEGGFIIT